MPKLKIYKASAGSGKTFQLVREYLLIVFNNPDEFQHVLGVTFTNKATGEMKSRILEELDKLSSGKSSDHLQALMEYFKKPEAWVKQRAALLYCRALHQYHEFHIQTIDSFFQQIIRGFARDIGLSAGFNLELDTDTVLNVCIEELLNDLQEESEYGEWLIRFAEQRIEDNKHWDLQAELFNFSKEVFREKFSTIADEIIAFVEDKNKMNALFSTIRSQVNDFEKRMDELGTRGLEIIEAHDLKIEDFSYGNKGFASVFQKVKNKDFDFGSRILAATNNMEAWYAKSQSKHIIEKIVGIYPILNPFFCEIIDLYKQDGKSYFAAVNAKKYLYQLGVLSLILQYIRKYRDEQDVILIPDTAPLIHQIVKHNEEAFIYEKTGTYFHHFLLDEFQDTSELQWENFKPLISNSISQDYVSLLVGDVKQSIYRFRNGDWRLLMYKAQQDIPYSEVISMDTNYRSAEMIVRFNNTLFSLIPSMLGEGFKKLFQQSGVDSEVPGWFELAYANQAQQFIPKNEKGYVWVKKFLKDNESNSHGSALDAMISIIEDALLRGYILRDIVILCRKYNDVEKAYDYLTKYGKPEWKIVSEKSLQLKNNGYVRMIFAALKWLAYPQDLISRANLITEVAKYKLKASDQALWNNIQNPPPSLNAFFEKSESIRQMVIIDAIIRIHELFDVAGLFDRNEDVIFFQTLLDEVIEFMRTGDHTLSALVDWLDEVGLEKSIQQSETMNAIRILTIHKSKGLEFPIVIIPFFNWSLNHENNTNNILWEKPPVELGWDVPMIPLSYKSELTKSYFAEHYLNERFAAAMDALNLMYVALTRPKNELYVFIQLNSESNKEEDNLPKNVGELLFKTIKYKIDVDDPRDLFVSLYSYFSESEMVFELGEKVGAIHEKNKMEESFLQQDFLLKLYWEKLFVKSISAKYLNVGAEERRKGIVIHELLSKVRYLDDFQQLIAEVTLYNPDAEGLAKELISLKNEFASHPLLQTWFDRKAEIITEQSIIASDGKEYRPDRIVRTANEIVVIDFKTGEQHPEHVQQVRQYKNVLQTIYKERVKAYLVYISYIQVIEVE